MRIVIVRHGEASFGADSDAQRPLTKKGKQEALSTAKQLQSWITDETKVIHSPFLRACETATVVSEALNLPMESNDVLKAGTDFRLILAWLQEAAFTDVILVSHNPMVTELTNLLVHGIDAVRRPMFVFDTGYACCLEGEYPAEGCVELQKRIIP